MWIVELAIDGNPDRLAARPAHRQKLAELHDQGMVRMAGPLADDSGALLVLDVADRAAVDTVLADDPYYYYSTPGVTVASIREWTPIIP